MNNDGELSLESVSEAVVFNDVAEITNIFKKMDLCTDGHAVRVPANIRYVIGYALSFAAAGAYRKKLTEEMALTIIKYTAPAVDFFGFSGAITYATNCVLKNDNSVEPRLRNILAEGVSAPDAGEIIDQMDIESFRNYLAYATNSDDVATISACFCEPTIRYIYQHNLIPPELLFALMGGHLASSREEDLLRNSIVLPVITLS